MSWHSSDADSLTFRHLQPVHWEIICIAHWLDLDLVVCCRCYWMEQTSSRYLCPGCAPRWAWSARSLCCLPPPLVSTLALAGRDPASRTLKRLPRPPMHTTSSPASQKGEKPTDWSLFSDVQPYSALYNTSQANPCLLKAFLSCVTAVLDALQLLAMCSCGQVDMTAFFFPKPQTEDKWPQMGFRDPA